MPSARRASGDSGIDLAVRGQTPPPALISCGRSRPSWSAAASNRRWRSAKRARRIGIGVEEDVAVVEGGHQPDLLATAACRCRTRRPTCRRCRHGEGLGLGVDAQLAEVALDRFPGAVRGDAHLLVVVAGRAARGEGVAEPEAVLLADRVGDSRRRWRCPCRRRRPDRDRRRRSAPRARGGTMPLADPVVGDVEQAAQDSLVAARRPLPWSAARSPPRGGRLTTKPPFAPTGTMTAFLTICAFIRPRTSVRKSSRRSDQRRPPRATLPPRRCTPSTYGRVDEDLEGRPRQRQARHRAPVELERQIGLVGAPSRSALAVVGAQGRLDQLADSGAGCGPRRGSRPGRGRRGIAPRARPAAPRGRRAASGSKRASNSSASMAGERRVGGQRLLDVGLAERDADLQDVLAVGAQDHDLAPVQPGASTRRLKPSFSSRPRQTPGNGVLEGARGPASTSSSPRLDRLQAEVVQPEAPAVGGVDLVGLLAACTRRPMFSSTGRASDSGTGWSRRISLKRSRLGRVLERADRASWPERRSRRAPAGRCWSMSGTAARASTRS